ncbi:hypothetical protein O3M35_007580 [Rhynocoris fuscipes]|uniref:Uncharacterized protein n=1 Tax=Rhynocoris fuscipes TaxID=488301 RepID=A0AAW1DAS3_9HEMI
MGVWVGSKNLKDNLHHLFLILEQLWRFLCTSLTTYAKMGWIQELDRLNYQSSIKECYSLWKMNGTKNDINEVYKVILISTFRERIKEGKQDEDGC